MHESINIDILNTSASLYQVFAPVNVTKIKDYDDLKSLFEKNGTEFNHTKRELKNLAWFYYGMLGRADELNLYFFFSEITAADQTGMVDRQFLMYFAAEALLIDGFLLDFFELFSEKRFCAPILKSEGTLETIVTNSSSWFAKFETTYLKNAAELTRKKLKNSKKVVDER